MHLLSSSAAWEVRMGGLCSELGGVVGGVLLAWGVLAPCGQVGGAGIPLTVAVALEPALAVEHVAEGRVVIIDVAAVPLLFLVRIAILGGAAYALLGANQQNPFGQSSKSGKKPSKPSKSSKPKRTCLQYSDGTTRSKTI